MSIAAGLFAVAAGLVCLLAGFLRRYTEDRGVLVLLYVGGLTLVYSGTVSLA